MYTRFCNRLKITSHAEKYEEKFMYELLMEQ